MIRPATIDDVPSIAALHVAGWQGAYGGIVDQAYLDSLSIEQRKADWQKWLASGETTVFIAEKDGRPGGFIAYGRTKTPPPGSSNIRPTHSAEIYGLYLHPDFWRQGMGRALLQAAAVDLRDKKHKSLCLWVLDGNARGKSFYESMGGQRIGKHMITIGPDDLKEICYGWRDTAPLAG